MARGPWGRMGWRNLGRNRRRTALTVLELAVGYWAVVVMTGMVNGMLADMIRTATDVLTGQIQIHAPDYLPDRSLYATLGGDRGVDLAGVLGRVDAEPGVRAAAPRVYAGGLLSAGASTAGVLLVGMDADREERVSRLTSAMTEGRLPAAGANEVVIGVELARQLAVTPGDTLVLVAPAADGSIGNDLFTVAGLYHTGLAGPDAQFALAPIGALQAVLALPPGRIHEIAVRVDDPWLAPAIATDLAATVRAGGDSLAVSPWTTFRPELADYAKLAGGSMWIVVVIVFAMAIFGVANTLLMTTFERRREFALLLALGAAPRGIVRSVLAEALALGALAMALGVAMAVPNLIWWHYHPLDLSRLFGDFSMAGALVRPVLRTEYPLGMFFLAGGALLLTALLAALYPAFRAVRVPPADALGGR